jgi:serine/threonine protein kinase
VLVDNEGHALVADFGLVTFFESVSPDASTYEGGNSRWMAPELQHPDYSVKRTTATDIYSLGCLMLEVLINIRSLRQMPNTRYHRPLPCKNLFPISLGMSLWSSMS